MIINALSKLESTVKALIVPIALGFASSAFAYMPSYCEFLFMDAHDLLPSRIEWSKRLEESTVISNQCQLGTCWLHSGLESVTRELRATGFLEKQDELSDEYYLLLSIQERLGKADSKLSYRERINSVVSGGTFSELLQLVERQGIITRTEFSKMVSSESILFGKNSEQILEIFSEAAHAGGGPSLKKDPSGFAQRMYRSISDGVSFPTQTKTVSLRSWNKIRGSRAFTSSNATLDLIDQTIIDRINSGVSVYAVFNAPQAEYTGMSRFGSSNRHVRNLREPNYTSSHAMSIVGYRAELDGRITHYLLKNSWGIDFGENGYVTVNRAFVLKYLMKIEGIHRGSF